MSGAVEYVYMNADGSPNRLVKRTADKRFSQFSSDGNGGWRPGLNGQPPVLYRLSYVLDAVENGEPVLICEGEKDAEAAFRAGVVATTNPGGAGKWHEGLSECLRDATVYIVWDVDEAGRRHALQVAESLKRVGAHVYFRRPRVGKDLSDHLDAGYTLADLEHKRPIDLGEKSRSSEMRVELVPRSFTRVLEALEDYAEDENLPMPQRQSDGSYQACCPSHDDGTKRGKPSLNLALGEKRTVLLHCFAGCKYQDIVEALGVDLRQANRDDHQSDHALIVRTADLSRAKPVSWAWHHRIPIGYLSLLLGAEGVGKGTFVAWLIAQLTKGTLPGDLRGEPAHVAIIGDEDSFDDVWTPRLHVAGADLSYVHTIERPDGGYIDFGMDRDRLAALVDEWDFALFYLDQILDNLGVKVDDWRSKHVRDALRPARLLARELDLAVFAAMHPNKRGSTFRELVSGAVAFNAVSRSSLMLSTHPDDIERRVLVRGKGNLSAAPSSVEFDIVEKRFEHDGEPFRQPVVANVASGDLTIDDLVGSSDPQSQSKASDARHLIADMLPNDGNWHPSRPIFDAGKAQGIDDRTIQKAKYALGIEHKREDKFQGSVLWKWPLTITMKRKESER